MLPTLTGSQRSLSARRLPSMNIEPYLLRDQKSRISDSGSLGSLLDAEVLEEGRDGEGTLFSWQFLLYYLVCLYGAMVVYFAGWTLSRKLDDRSPGTISLHDEMGLHKYMGHSLDVSDDFWRINRPFVIPLTLIFLAFVAVSRLIGSWKRAWLRKWFYATAGICFTGYLHGAFASIHLLAAGMNLAVCHVLAGTSLGPPVIWGLNISSLLCSQVSSPHFPVHHMVFRMWPSRYPWQWPFWLLVLRMLSFSLDLHKSRIAAQDLDGCGDHPKLKPKSKKAAVSEPLDLSSFSIAAYLAYLFYPPLYLVGPLPTYSSFINQVDQPTRVPFAKVFDYGAWVFLFIGIMELYCRCFYVKGFVSSGLWDRTGKILGYNLQGADFVAVAILNLVFIFLVYHICWRFSRFWALLDNVWVPENEDRSVLTLYSFKAFTRRWNASLHIWLSNYIYKPLGGGTQSLRNSFIVFVFVAALLGLSPLTLSVALFATALYKIDQVVGAWLKTRRKANPLTGKADLHLSATFAALSIIMTCALILVLRVLRGQSWRYAVMLFNFPLQLVATFLVAFALAHILLAVRHRSSSSI